MKLLVIEVISNEMKLVIIDIMQILWNIFRKHF